MRSWFRSRRRLLVKGAVAGSLVVVVVANVIGGGGSPSTAHIWVDQNGGTCLDSGTQVAYSDAAACSWDAANDTCEGGDQVRVKGGPTYGNVTLSGSNARASVCTFTTAAGESVTIASLSNGEVTGGDTGADWITLVGPGTIREFDSDQTNRVTVDGWDFNFQNSVCQCFHIEGVTNFVARNSEIHHAMAHAMVGSMIYMSGTGITIEDSQIHHALLDDDVAHTECIYATSVDGLVLKRNIFHTCAVMDVFLTGSNTTSDGLIESNVFGRACSGGPGDLACVQPLGNTFHFRDGAVDPRPHPSNWDFRYNTFVGNLSIGASSNAPLAGGLRVIGNVFLSGAPCGLANTTYSYNAHVSGGCGGTGTITNASLLSNSFIDPSDLPGPGNWGLLTGSPLKNAGNNADQPATDRVGVTRPQGATPDIGAYEFPGG